MRITFNQLRDGVDQINSAAERMSRAQGEVSSGLRVQKPSDDPLSAQRAVLDQSTLDSIDSYKNVAGAASSRLNAMDATLSNMVDLLTQALTTTQGATGSTATQGTRDAAASALASVRDAIAGDINSSFNGAHPFSGGNPSVVPYAKVSGTWTYQGASGTQSVEIAPGRKVALTADGQAILKGSDATDILSTLDSLATAARNNDNATLKAGLDSIHNALNRVTLAQSYVGYDESNLTDGNTLLASLRTEAASRLSEDREANMADAITELSRAQQGYQAAISAYGSTSKLSLMDYIK